MVTKDWETVSKHVHGLLDHLDAVTAALEHIAAGHASGSDVFPILYRRVRNDAFFTAVTVLAMSDEDLQELLNASDLAPDQKAALQGLRTGFYQTLGVLCKKFLESFAEGLERSVDYINVRPRYAPDDDQVLLDIKFFAGEELVFRTVDTAASLVWLAERLIANTVKWLEWAQANRMAVNAGQCSALQEHARSLTRHMEKLKALEFVASGLEEGPRSEPAPEQAEAGGPAADE